ncbi:hypothetical protein LRF89_06645 [Halorhodospira sp. 9621]|uniref:hypothetical protein n=1 Tax=Halorhodospira TaxID=85108 RepID=UPI001911FFAC|nr:MULTISPECIES: hypothetical protein [Halorhodospira]MBK5943333.1 hypothetical protein [Halorhodospira halophila]MCG5526858.1 hypothetical protein [Halorhodospira halophila]MCG5533119.1 hypothetical protein [Halorhodospira sp. 9621]MCG5537874.1 hypothetical protein [Halorhodospira sp. 9622]MCG5542805.1 hypothetical protein [Halorhodospira sp. 9628]
MIRTYSAKLAITIATLHGWQTPESDQMRYRCRIDFSPATSTAGAVAHGIDCGRVLAAVDDCPEPSRLWLYIAYAEPAAEWVSDEGVFRLHDLLTLAVRERIPGLKVAADRLESLMLAAMGDKRWTGLGNPRLRPADYARKVGFPRQSWPNYRRVVQAAHDQIDDWEAVGLKRVAAVLDSRLPDIDAQQV